MGRSIWHARRVPLDRLTKLDPLQLGRFTILARLGGGGMGNVYLAEADDGTPAAVKVIRAELAKDPQFRARFRREVEAGRRVQNRCIARYLDADTFAASPWLATEFVPGPTLHHDVFASGPVTGPRVVGLGIGLADALVAIHGAGLVHRDLKPANILLAPDAPKVIDFGISLAADATALTSTGTLVGSPAYMSPEQAKGIRDVGPPADVFSWASCMTFASRREPPFGEGEAAGLLYKVVHDEPDLSGLAPALFPFVRAALDKDPGNRPTALELVAGLTAVLDGVPAKTLVVPPPEGGAAKVVAPLSGANAGRVLAATWSPDPVSLEQAEATLSEARDLRASLPPRAEERSRRDRVRAKRAVFAAMVLGLVALLAVGITTFRPGQAELAEPADTGLGADPDPTTTTTLTGDGAVAAAAAAVPATSSTAVPGYTETPAGAPTTAAPATTTPPAAGAPVTAGTTPTTAPPTTPFTVAPRCTAVIPGAPAGQATGLPASPQTYSVRITVSAVVPSGNLVLLRRNQGQRPREAWVKPIGSGGAGQPVEIGSFKMVVQPSGETLYEAALTTHSDPAGAAFDLELRPNGRSPLSCGQLSGAPA
jgi:hypothetical protein